MDRALSSGGLAEAVGKGRGGEEGLRAEDDNDKDAWRTSTPILCEGHEVEPNPLNAVVDAGGEWELEGAGGLEDLPRGLASGSVHGFSAYGLIS